MSNNKGGRPTKFTDETVQKLESAFLMGCTDLEACLAANISKSSLYNYQEWFPGFLERKEALKKNPVLKARSVVMDAMDSGDEKVAQWVIDKHDGKAKQAVDLTSSDGTMTPKGVTVDMTAEEAAKAYAEMVKGGK